MLGHRLRKYTEKYPTVKVKKVVTRDRPVRALTDAAEGAQLLVVGLSRSRWFQGHAAWFHLALLQASPCPMMVVRPGATSSAVNSLQNRENMPSWQSVTER